MKQLFFLLAIALLFFIPRAMAFDCSKLNQSEAYICNYVQDSNLTQVEKDLIIADIFNPNRTIPNFDFVYYWNTALNITDSPDNHTTDQGTIKEAWLKIITLMPSILENNTLYGSTQGTLMSAFNYSVILPTEKESGDCRTTYSLVSNLNTLDVNLNGNTIGHDKLTSFSLSEPEDLNFNSVLNIWVEYRIKHYKLDDNKKCVYKSTEYQIDTLTLKDNFFANAYQKEPISYFKITNKVLGTTKGFIEANDTKERNLIISPSLKEIRNLVNGLKEFGNCRIIACEEITTRKISCPESKEICSFVKKVNEDDLNSAVQKIRLMKRFYS